MVWHHLLPHRTEARSGVHDHQGLRRGVDSWRLKPLDGVTGLLEGVGSPSNTGLHLLCGSLAGRVEHHSGSDGLDWFGPAKRRGNRPRVRQVGPAMTANASRRSATRRASGPLTCVSCIPIVAMSVASTVLACGMRPNVGLSALTPQHCAGWRRSEAVIPKTQRTHAGRYSGSLARA
jgi:hypothetical protein